jgi:hypothetical protein
MGAFSSIYFTNPKDAIQFLLGPNLRLICSKFSKVTCDWIVLFEAILSHSFYHPSLSFTTNLSSTLFARRFVYSGRK